MDQLKGAFNSFSQGNKQQGQHQQQPQGEGSYQQPSGGLGGMLNSFAGGNNQQGQHQQQPQGQQGGGLGGMLNSFAGGNNQQGQHQQQPQGQQGGGGFGGMMNSFTGGNNQQGQHQQVPQGEGSQQQGGLGGMFGGFTNKMNNAAGGGPESEKNEDYLDKGIDFVQEKFMGKGPQNNESAVEQAKDEQISDFIRDKYKSTTGKDFFIKDKETRLG